MDKLVDEEKNNKKNKKLVISSTQAIHILVQYSDKFMYSIVLYSIVSSRSQLFCIVNLLLCGYNTIQCNA